jgi:hypothetical protein
VGEEHALDFDTVLEPNAETPRETLERCRGQLVMGKTLSLGGGSDVHLIDGCNLPETGFGS